MHRLILIFFAVHQINCFMHDSNDDLMKRNNEIINNLFVNPPIIKSHDLIDVSLDQNQTDIDFISKFIRNDNRTFQPIISSVSLLNHLKNDSKIVYLFRQSSDHLNKTDELKHNIFKREMNSFSENEDEFDLRFNDDLSKLRSEFEPFMTTRSPTDSSNKAIIRDYIISKFNNLRMKTYKQPFQIASVDTNTVKKGVNLFSYYPSRQRKQALRENRKILNDHLLVLGAHYDTVNNSTGIDDNASGIVNLLELARMLNFNRINLDYTIIFVCFDFEELGLHGSKAFVDKFLIPVELMERQSQFIGAIITDMLLNYNDQPNSQVLPQDIKRKVPKVTKMSEDNQFRGNYIAAWNRRNVDKNLMNNLIDVWKKSPDYHRFKLFSMDPRLPRIIRPANARNLNDLGTFIRSDHANFWYPKTKNFDKTLNAVLLTDLGPWRSPSNVCYHKACDDESQLTKKNLEFFQHTNKMLYIMLTENPPTVDNALLNDRIDLSIRNPISNRIPRFQNLVF